MRPQRFGFTLIELLVVISIIAVLASMLLPAIGMVRQAAKTTACASGMRQIVAAAFAYAEDEDGVVVPTKIKQVSGQNWMWPILTASYVEAAPDGTTSHGAIYPNAVYFACKQSATGGSGLIRDAIAAGSAPLTTMWIWNVSSGIGVNGFPLHTASADGPASDFNYQAGTGQRISLSRVSNKSSRGYFGDGTNYFLKAAEIGPYNCVASVSNPAGAADWIALGWKYFRVDPERHQGKMNIAFFDGHVQSAPATTAYLAFHDPVSFP